MSMYNYFVVTTSGAGAQDFHRVLRAPLGCGWMDAQAEQYAGRGKWLADSTNAGNGMRNSQPGGLKYTDRKHAEGHMRAMAKRERRS